MGQALVRVVDGPNRGVLLDLPLGRRVVVGRGDGVDLQLTDEAVSARHCALEHRLAGVFVEDLRSEAGTVLDGERLNGEGVLASERASLRLGTSTLEIVRDRPQEPLPALPGFTVLRPLGRGASGQVYEAVETSTRQVVAIKILAEDADAVSRQRFEREASLRDRLKHPGIAEILRLTRIDGRPCLIRELVPGRSLERRLVEDGPLHWSAAFAVGLTIAQALAHAHSKGVIHRDVKPANVIMDCNDRAPKLIDFDLAKRTPESMQASLTRLTHTGQGLGSLSYVAPEQLMGARDVGPQADLYGLGLTLYHLIGGQRPFSDVEPEAFIAALTETGPRPLRGVSPKTPERACRILEEAYHPDPSQRYPDARSFAMALSQGIAGSGDR